MDKVNLGKYVNIKTGKLDANASNINGKYPFFTCSNEPLRINDYSYDCECVLVAGNGDLNVKYYNGKFDAYQRTYIIESKDKQLLNTKYLYYLISSNIEKLRKNAIGGVIKYIKLGNLTNIKLELIEINEQNQIVKELDKVQKVIDMRKKQIEELEELVKSQFEKIVENIEEEIYLNYYINSLNAGKSLAGELECKNKVLKTGSVSYDYFDKKQVKNLPVDYTPQREHLVKKGDVIISRMNTVELVGACGYVWDNVENLYYPDRLWKANLNNNCNAIFIWQSIIQQNFKSKIRKICSGTSGSMKNISKEKFLNLKIKKVPIELQNQFANIVKQVNKRKGEIQKSLEELGKLQNSLSNKYFN